MVTIGKRCPQHFENNCQIPYCIWDAKQAKTDPRRIRPRRTEGAPEVSWAIPHRKVVELALLEGDEE